MRRRDFIQAVVISAVSRPLTARAQQSALPVVGFVNAEAANSEYADMAVLFRAGLQETGFVDGQNVIVENHWADNHNDRLPAILADLVRRQVAVIVATTTPAALAAKTTVTTVPVIFETGGDPIQHGLVSSLNHPGGNITGVSQSNQEVAPKRLELLREALPQAKVIALLINSTNPTLAANIAASLRVAAQDLGVELRSLEVQSEGDFNKAFAGAVEMRAAGLIIGDDPFMTIRKSSAPWRRVTALPRSTRDVNSSRPAG
jgi:putative ABC transport system substrate-binding protein